MQTLYEMKANEFKKLKSKYLDGESEHRIAMKI